MGWIKGKKESEKEKESEVQKLKNKLKEKLQHLEKCIKEKQKLKKAS